MKSSLKTPLIALLSLILIGATYFTLYHLYLAPRAYNDPNLAPSEQALSPADVTKITEEPSIEVTPVIVPDTKSYEIPIITAPSPTNAAQIPETMIPDAPRQPEEADSVSDVHTGSVVLSEPAEITPPTDAPILENTKSVEHPVSHQVEQAHKDTEVTTENFATKMIDGELHVYWDGEWVKSGGADFIIADFELTGNLIGD